MTLKLAGITFENAPRLPGVRPGDLSSIDLNNVPPALVGWQITVRVASVLFISPRGWTPATATAPHQRDHEGPLHIHEVPRSNLFLHWTGAPEDVDTVIKSGKFETGVLGIKPVDESRPLLAQIPSGQMGDA